MLPTQLANLRQNLTNAIKTQDSPMYRLETLWWLIRRQCRDYWDMMRGRLPRMTAEDMERELERRYGIPRSHTVKSE